MTDFKNAAELNAHLATRSYIKGFAFSAEDTKAFNKLGAIPSAKAAPHAYRWALHVIAVAGVTNVTFSGAAAAAGADDDMDDMFGDDGDETAEENAANKARADRMANALRLKEEKDAKEGKVKVVKAKPVEKSLLVLDVKPWEADTDLVFVWNEIKKYEQDGLTWGLSHKLEPIAYGIKKLVMTCTIVDSKVLVEDITDAIEALEDHVQSVTVASMNKIS
jgi:elongation factor 1-beta